MLGLYIVQEPCDRVAQLRGPPVTQDPRDIMQDLVQLVTRDERAPVLRNLDHVGIVQLLRGLKGIVTW